MRTLERNQFGTLPDYNSRDGRVLRNELWPEDLSGNLALAHNGQSLLALQ